MKLRNKKTGDIVVLSGITCKGDITFMRFDDEKGTFMFAVHSLAELNEEWEDYEEPKEHYILNGIGIVRESTLRNTPKYRKEIVELIINNNKSIDNYFDTREEAEKAVEKLKAWKRLKEDGFTILGYEDTDRGTTGDLTIYVNIPECNLDDRKQDFDLLFGGEE